MEHDTGDAEAREVRAEFPAEGAFVVALRALTSALAAQCELTVDEIEDLQLAVNEAFGLLLPHASGTARQLLVRFGLSTRQLHITMRIPAADGASVDRDGLPWTFLSALADQLDVRTADGALEISLTKRREVAAP